MDYNKYYLQQAQGNVFRGAIVQKGYGLGGAFKRFFSWFVPILKENSMPLVKKVGKEVISNITNIANDTLNGQNFEDSLKKNVENSFKKINQDGKGYKRKRNLKKENKKSNKIIKNKKRILDIFG